MIMKLDIYLRKKKNMLLRLKEKGYLDDEIFITKKMKNL